jgi:glycosyltransferase involved in cell wall biosynthesis
MIGRLITFLFYAMIATWMLRGIINWARASWYDLRQIDWRRKLAQHPNARHLRRRPLMNVVVFADNDEATVIDCLQSLLRGSYKKLEIIVIDNASKDATNRLTRDFIKTNPKHALRLVSKRRVEPRDQAIKHAARWVSGDLVAVMDASCVIDKPALKNSFLRLADTNVDGVLMNVRLDHNYRLFGLADKLRAAATIWSKKSGSYISSLQDSYNYAAVYRADLWEDMLRYRPDALSEINALNPSAVGYDSQAIVTSYKSELSPLKLQALPELLIALFMIFVALKFNNANYILLAWFTFTLLLILAIWSDESLGWRTKVMNSLISLVTYSLLILEMLVSVSRLTAAKLRPYYAGPLSVQLPFPTPLPGR